MDKKEILEQLRSGQPPPADYPGMTFCAGRYYLGMFYVDVPEMGQHGGNITFQAWRFDGESNRWHLTYRFRYYVDSSGSPDAPDKRSWWHATFECDERQIQEVLQAFIKTLTKTVTNGRPVRGGSFLIRGDWNRALHLLRTSPPDWMHCTVVKAE